MKNKEYILFTVLILTFFVTFTSCKKNKEAPSIKVETPNQHAKHNWGDEVHIEASFTDDSGLASYTVTMGDKDGVENTAFGLMEKGKISGTTYEFHEHFTVPDSAPEMAWIHFTVTDVENETTTKKWMLHFEE